MVYVFGAPAAAVVVLLERFLRRMQNQARKPMNASPRMGPTTTPAIHALLEDFFFVGFDVSVGLAGALSPLPSEVVAAVVDRGADGCDVVFASSGCTR